VSGPEQISRNDQPSFSLDDEPISKAYQEGRAEVAKLYADEARRLLTAIDEHRCVRKDGTPTQKTKERALYLAKECSALEQPLSDEILKLLARCLHINDPYKYPGIPARNGKHWKMAVNYEAQQAPDILSVPNFNFASAYQVARHVWPDRDPVDSHKTIEHWRKYPEYRDDVRLCWYGQHPEKVSAKVRRSLQRGDADSGTS
jgi:hypothetical protein